jgi:very-short-patch-repair endonuclease
VGRKRRESLVLPIALDVLLPLAGKRRAEGLDGADLDVFLARLATRQEGVASRRQLAALGFTRNEIDNRISRRRLICVYQGVYAVGHEALSDRGRMIAALLAAGQGAALSHRTAAYHWRLLPSMPQFPDVTLTDRAPRRRENLRVHHAKRLDVTTHQGLPVTTPLQTIAQLAPDERDRARAEALVLKLIPRSADDHAEPTRSELERALLPALRKARLPRPVVGAELLGYTVDFFWPDHNLVVETDGWGTHGHRRAFETDRARDATLQAHGYTVVRFTWRQVIHETLLVTVRIAQLLTRTTVRPGPGVDLTPHHALPTPPAGG